MTHVRSVPAVLLFTAVFGLSACGDSPVDSPPPEVEIVIAGGDGQYGVPGQRLLDPLQVLVRRADSKAPRSGVAVSWIVESGDASLVTNSVGTTDADGVAEAILLLGSTPGPVRVRAEVRQGGDVSIVLDAYVAHTPALQRLSAPTARGGDTLSIDGTGFSPTPEQNVVLFSGIRGRVLVASSTSLTVEVPRCLPARDVSVIAQLGSLSSGALPLAVTEDVGDVLDLGGGIPLDIRDDHGFTCVRLPGGGSPYLLIVESTGTVGAASYGFTLTGLTTSGEPTQPGLVAPPPLPSHVATRATPRATPGVAQAFEARLRAAEASMVGRGRGILPAAPARTTAEVPTVGDRRSFKVLNGGGGFDDVTAVARLVSEQAVIYLDQRAPSGGFTDQDLADFAADFDEVIFPTDTAAFGAPSDLDGNGRVVILFTPTVNRLTPRGSKGFVGGFFYGLDLQPELPGSNQSEIFYGMVPDPQGQFSDARGRDQILQAMPAILAHEFQHMVHFNQRMLVAKASGSEALWLSEGMAQMAEELVSLAFRKRGDAATADSYREGNVKRARYYLADPSAWSLIFGTGQGTLEERGGAWLYTLYLWDRGGGDEVLRKLARSTRTGTENVEAVMRTSWRELFADWAASLYLDGVGNRPYPFEYSLQLRDLLRISGGFPLSPELVGGEDFTSTGQLWSSSMQHYIVVPPRSGSVALRLGGVAGGNAPAVAELGFRIVRLY